jgi:hypothetical protein
MSKQILIAAAVVVALLAAYFFLTKPEPRREAGASWSMPALQAFDRLELRRGGTEIVLERRDNGWRLTRPIDFDVQPRALERVEDVFATPDRRLLVDNEKAATPHNLTRYGFDDEDAFGVRVYDGGQLSASFTVGRTEQTPSAGARTWVRPEGADQLYRLNADLRAALDHELDAWRNNELLALAREERDAIAAVDLRYGERQLRLEREGGTWTLVEPPDVEIDSELVTRWLRQIDRLRAARFADGVSEAEAGLERPEHTVTLHLGEGTERRLELGAAFAEATDEDDAGRERRRYARVDDGPILVVSERDAERYMKRSGDFRPRGVLSLEREAVARLDLVDDDARVILVRDPRPEEAEEGEEGSEATWRMQRVGRDETNISDRQLQPVAMGELRRLLTAATSVEAQRFDDEIAAASAGFSTPRRTVIVQLEDGTAHEIVVGGEAAGAGDEGRAEADHYVRVDDGDVFVLRAFKVRDLLTTFEQLTPEAEGDESG